MRVAFKREWAYFHITKECTATLSKIVHVCADIDDAHDCIAAVLSQVGMEVAKE